MAIPLAIAGVAMAAVGAIRSANAKASAADYNSAIASQNAMVASEQGEAAAQAQSRDAERRIGQGVAAYGASGVDVGSGSPTDVLADSARSAMLDNLTIKYNASLRAAGYKDQSLLENANSQEATTSGYLAAAGAVVGGLGRMYGGGMGGQSFGG